MKPALLVAALAAIGIVATIAIDTTFAFTFTVDANVNGAWQTAATETSAETYTPTTPLAVPANGSLAMRVHLDNGRLLAISGPVLATFQMFGAGASSREVGRLANGLARGETHDFAFAVNASEVRAGCGTPTAIAVQQKTPAPPCSSSGAQMTIVTPAKTYYVSLQFEVSS
ncbi:MAG: hypothetical protein ACYDCK_10445 [Thermoplasmatota archaeon]